MGYFKTMHNLRTDWCCMTGPDEGINGRSLQRPCGKVLGGSSSINGYLCVRGQAEDDDRWAELGNRGWASDDVLRYCKKTEDQERGADEHHGIGGPLKVSDLRLRRPIGDCFIQTATVIGIPLNGDYKGASQEGVGYFQQTVHKGFRWSAARGLSRPARKQPNPRVETNARTTRIPFEGRRAVGIEYRKRDRVAVGGVKVARRIVEAPSLVPHIIGEYAPGRRFQSDAELLHAARQYSQSVYHPTGTCEMGHDAAAEVDDRLRVHGIQHLTVVGASIMPGIVSGNTDAPTIVPAEDAADMLREENLI